METVLSKTIEEIVDIINKEEISKYEIEVMFLKIRIVLESLNKKNDYGILNLYCNWIAHPLIDRSCLIVEILHRLTFTISEYDIQTNQEDKSKIKSFNYFVVKAIDPNQLWFEFTQFFKAIIGINDFNLDKKDWLQLFKFLVDIIAGRPLRLPEKNITKACKEKYQDIVNFLDASGKNGGIVEFSFKVATNQVNNSPFKNGELLWNLKRKDNIQLFGRF